MFYIFYESAFLVPGRGISDLRCHIKIAQNIKVIDFVAPGCSFAPPYKFYHFFTALLSFLTGRNYELSSAIVLTSSQIATYFITLHIFELEVNGFEKKLWKRILSISTLIVIALPYKFYLYLPQGSPNVWHNPTYVVMRPFALISFYSFYKIIEFENKFTEKCRKYYLLFSISTLISVIAKPSFVLTFLFAAGIFVLIRIIKERFNNIMFGFKLFLSVLPTLIVLFWQYIFIKQFEILHTSISFGTFLKLNLFDSFYATFCAIIFPFSATLAVFKNDKYKNVLKIGWLNVLVGWLQYYFLIQETSPTGDFAWGYMFSLYLLYLFLIISIFDTIKSDKKNNVIYYVSIILYIVQLFCGVYYFYIVLNRFDYIFPTLFDIKWFSIK